MISVLQVCRKKNPLFFSIEKVFGLIRPTLEKKALLSTLVLPHYSSGIVNIVRNLYNVKASAKAEVFHIIGDVHYAALALPRSKTILTIHDCVFLHASTGLKRKVLKWLLLDMPVKRSAVVTTISEFSKMEILRFTHCSADKIVVIPNPVNSNIVFQHKEFNTQKPVILFIGTTPNKNLERVAEALRGISCHLQILGNLTPEQQAVLANNDVAFSTRSNISETELSLLYAQSDIILFVSTFEGFGLPILEAQKAGRVVITSNTEPMKTVAGKGAILADPYSTASIREAVMLAVTDQTMREASIAQGYVNLKKYEAEAVAAAYFLLYESLAAHKKTA